MKNYLYITLTGIILLLIGITNYQKHKIHKYKELYNTTLQNVEAYQSANSGLEDNIREYQMTVDNLRISKDSVDRKISKVINELKIKDKKIEYLQYQTKVIYKTDTIQTQDTILVPTAHIDTLVGDNWYDLRLQLSYPSTIIVSPTFRSEQYVVINSNKQYYKKPSKLFFIRWFQKKYNIVEVHVEEKSPYIRNKENKFIKVIK